VAFGLLTRWISPRRRTLVALLPALILLVVASDASFALAENLRLSGVLSTRVPPSGAWFEALLFAAGAAVAGLEIGRLPRLGGARGRELLPRTRRVGTRPA
jgi:hypothetical protein